MKEERSGAPDSARLFGASRARAGASTGVPAPTRVVCSGHTQTGINNNTCLSDHAHVRAKARRRKFTEAEVSAWRERIFADGLEDPVKVAVAEAVRGTFRGPKIYIVKKS